MESQIHQLSHQDVLKDAFASKVEVKPTTRAEILDLEELKDYQGRKRTEFENVLKVKRSDIKQWMRYAQFEIEQHDLRRARSVFERALLVNHSHVPLWIRYIDGELKAKNVNHARNLLERATSLLPRIDKLWLKYVIIEESLGNISAVRGLFSRWCSLEPGRNAFTSFVEFETRCGEFANVREVYSRYVLVHPSVETWLAWISFEKKHGSVDTIRQTLSLGLDTLSFYNSTSPEDIATIVNVFAKWEASQQEYERASTLYGLATQKWPNNEVLASNRVQFEKMYAVDSKLDESVVEKRKREYRSTLATNPRDYETWWIYLELIELHYPNELASALEASLANNAPQDDTKTTVWRRYIYLWIRALIVFELNFGQYGKVRAMFEILTKEIIPNKRFTFAKIWTMYAKFELRQGNVTTARKILGWALGTCPKDKIYKDYIQLELDLKEFDRVRKLYEHFLAFNPYNISTWLSYAELEDNLGDEERARGIYLIAMSEAVGLNYDGRFKISKELINFETLAGEYTKAVDAYKDLLELSSHDVNIWIELAAFESSIPTAEQLTSKLDASEVVDDDEEDGKAEEEETLEVTETHKLKSRQVFRDAISYYKKFGDKRSRLTVLRAWADYEDVHGTPETQSGVREKFPIEKVKTRQQDGMEVEFVDLEYPDDKDEDKSQDFKADTKSRLLAMAQKWQREKGSL
ncbi:LADA_0F02278g1_1 [Lachancea dasiensis]|uniref:Pre-mRNA-splicing factor CLF1 n=1 Tax=Lachancea dasiensis TaxID=1072105 RepID=A0A1G4JIA4_9SACH|nr:LADA_0F02278g1_1 [Lachancea dasiensis]